MSEKAFTCHNCGRVGYGKSDGTGSFNDPSGWKYNKMMGFGRYIFCSDKCLREYKASKSDGDETSENNSNSNSNDGIIKTALKGAVRGKTAEENIAETELEKERLRMEHELELRRLDDKKEKDEKKEKKNNDRKARLAKQAEGLRSNGRPFAAFITQNQNYIIIGSIIGIWLAIVQSSTIIIPIIVCLILGGGVYMYFNEKNKSSK